MCARPHARVRTRVSTHDARALVQQASTSQRRALGQDLVEAGDPREAGDVELLPNLLKDPRVEPAEAHLAPVTLH